MNKSIGITEQMFVELTENEMIETEGGIMLALALATVGCFGGGFSLGKELGDKLWG